MLNSRQIFLNNLAQCSDIPLGIAVERAEGLYFYSPEGRKYIDLISGIAVSNLGHRHPKVVKAIKNQVDKYMHVMVYGELVQSPQSLYAKKLLDTLPSGFDNVYFVNSGSEAIETAMKLVRKATQRHEIIACRKAYHGSFLGSLSLTGDESLKRNYRPLLPAVKHIDFGSFRDIEQEITEETAGVFIEVVQGEAGVIEACSHYFQTLRKRCRDTETLLVFDEIQSGFGRTGKFWAFEHYGIVPDVIASAKAAGGGLPLGAVLTSKELMDTFKSNPILGHITTFGGHPVCCAAGLASLEVIFEEGLLEKVEEKARLFRKLLVHPRIKSIRNKGLMMAVDFGSFDRMKAVVDRAVELGILTDWFLFNDTSMRIAPPLIITGVQIEEACNLLLQAIGTAKWT